MNPYETPIDDRPGVYDRSLMKRVAFAFLLVAVWFAALSAMALWSQYKTIGSFNSCDSLWEAFIAFFWDWTSIQKES